MVVLISLIVQSVRSHAEQCCNAVVADTLLLPLQLEARHDTLVTIAVTIAKQPTVLYTGQETQHTRLKHDILNSAESGYLHRDGFQVQSTNKYMAYIQYRTVTPAHVL